MLQYLVWAELRELIDAISTLIRTWKEYAFLRFPA